MLSYQVYMLLLSKPAAKAVAQTVKSDNRQHDEYARRKGAPRRIEQKVLRFREHSAPAWQGRLYAQTKVAH